MDIVLPSTRQVFIDEQVGLSAPSTTCSGTVFAYLTVDGGFYNVSAEGATAFPQSVATIPLSATVVLGAGVHHVGVFVIESGLGTVDVSGPASTAVDLGPTSSAVTLNDSPPLTGGGNGPPQSCPTPTP